MGRASVLPHLVQQLLLIRAVVRHQLAYRLHIILIERTQDLTNQIHRQRRPQIEAALAFGNHQRLIKRRDRSGATACGQANKQSDPQ